LSLDSRWTLAAVVAGMAVVTKSQGVLALVPVLAVACARRDWRNLVRSCAIAGALTMGVLGIGSWLTSGELLQQAVLFQFVRPSEHSLADDGGLLGWLTAPETRVLAAFALLGLTRIRKAWDVDKGATAAVLCWIAFSFVLVARSYSYYYHYWPQVALPLALVGGFVVLAPATVALSKVRRASLAVMALALVRSELQVAAFRAGDGAASLIRAHAAQMSTIGFDPAVWANIVLNQSAPAVDGKLVIDGYATKQYLQLRPFSVARIWAPYDWQSMGSTLIRESDWVWTDPKGERLLLPDQQALRSSLFVEDYGQGSYLLYSRTA